MKMALKFAAKAADEAVRGIKAETFSSTMQDRFASDGVFVKAVERKDMLEAMSLSSLLYYVLIGEGGIADDTA